MLEQIVVNEANDGTENKFNSTERVTDRNMSTRRIRDEMCCEQFSSQQVREGDTKLNNYIKHVHSEQPNTEKGVLLKNSQAASNVTSLSEKNKSVLPLTSIKKYEIQLFTRETMHQKKLSKNAFITDITNENILYNSNYNNNNCYNNSNKKMITPIRRHSCSAIERGEVSMEKDRYRKTYRREKTLSPRQQFSQKITESENKDIEKLEKKIPTNWREECEVQESKRHNSYYLDQHNEESLCKCITNSYNDQESEMTRNIEYRRHTNIINSEHNICSHDESKDVCVECKNDDLELFTSKKLFVESNVREPKFKEEEMSRQSLKYDLQLEPELKSEDVTAKRAICRELLIESSSDEYLNEKSKNDTNNCNKKQNKFANVDVDDDDNSINIVCRNSNNLLSSKYDLQLGNLSTEQLKELTLSLEKSEYAENVHRQTSVIKWQDVGKTKSNDDKQKLQKFTQNVSAEKAQIRLLLCEDSESVNSCANVNEDVKQNCEVKKGEEVKLLIKEEPNFVSLETCEKIDELPTDEKQIIKNVRDKKTISELEVLNEYLESDANESIIKAARKEIALTNNNDDVKDSNDKVYINMKENPLEHVNCKNYASTSGVSLTANKTRQSFNDVDGVTKYFSFLSVDSSNSSSEEGHTNYCETLQEHKKEELSKEKKEEIEANTNILKVKECSADISKNVNTTTTNNNNDDDDDDSADDTECCICLEKYTTDNPKCTSLCHHHFHLPCLLSWKQRCNTCPMCNMETISNIDENFNATGSVDKISSLSCETLPDTSNDEVIARQLQQKYYRRERRVRQRNTALRQISSLNDEDQLNDKSNKYINNKLLNSSKNRIGEKYKEEEQPHIDNQINKQKYNFSGELKPASTKRCLLQSGKTEDEHDYKRKNKSTLFASNIDEYSPPLQLSLPQKLNGRVQTEAQAARVETRSSCLPKRKVYCKDADKSKPCSVM